jgi:hypothetical protein
LLADVEAFFGAPRSDIPALTATGGTSTPRGRM